MKAGLRWHCRCCGKPSTQTEREAQKSAAAERAAALVRSGMLLGLGTGSTAAYFVDALGSQIRQGLEVEAVPTSEATARQAAALGIRLRQHVDRPLDLAVDGADEIDPERRLVKGRGGALFREKLVAVNAKRFVVIADGSKLVDRLGRGVVPVEVLPFLWERTAHRLAGLGCEWTLRGGEVPYRTDNGNLILDLRFRSGIDDPEAVGDRIKGTVGVVEHGLYLGLATACIVAEAKGITVLGTLD